MSFLSTSCAPKKQPIQTCLFIPLQKVKDHCERSWLSLQCSKLQSQFLHLTAPWDSNFGCLLLQLLVVSLNHVCFEVVLSRCCFTQEKKLCLLNPLFLAWNKYKTQTFGKQGFWINENKPNKAFLHTMALLLDSANAVVHVVHHLPGPETLFHAVPIGSLWCTSVGRTCCNMF